MLRPPDELGSVAFSQAHSVRGLPAMFPRVDRIKWAKAETACCIWLGGQHLSEKAIFGSARQERATLSPFVNPLGLAAWTPLRHFLYSLHHFGLTVRRGANWQVETFSGGGDV